MGRILSLNGRPADTVEIRMRVSRDLAAHIASQRQVAEAAIRDLGVALAHCMKLAGLTEFTMDLETLKATLPEAARLKRQFGLDGSMTVSYLGREAEQEGRTDAQANLRPDDSGGALH